jgi:hypothetical protein
MAFTTAPVEVVHPSGDNVSVPAPELLADNARLHAYAGQASLNCAHGYVTVVHLPAP